MNEKNKYDVVVVGLGPAGATLAHLLGLCGVNTLVIEKEAEAYHLPRAVHFDDEVMRVFQTIGISDELKDKLIINKGMKFVDENENLLLDWPRPQEVGKQGWHASYRFHQPDLEEILRSSLKKYKHVDIKTQCEVTSLSEGKSSVTITYKDLVKNATLEVNAKYIVGCDGARSFVRKQIDPEMNDLGFAERWLVVDVLLKNNLPRLGDYTIQHCRTDRPATYAKGPENRRRWEIAVLDDEDSEQIASDRSVWKLLKPWITSDDADLERSAVYTFHSLIAQQWRKGRLLIAGDAAHLTPPFMGQGMCAGIRDVSNLAWKLALCVQGKSTDEILDTYESERIPHVEEYISTAVKLGGLINTCGTEEALKAAFPSENGSVRMKSLNVGLGEGLSLKGHIQNGHVFAQPKIDEQTLADDIAGYSPILFVSSDLEEKANNAVTTQEKGITIISSKNEEEVAELLGSLDVNAALVRPDRYLLGVANNSEELNKLLAQTTPSATKPSVISERVEC